MTRAVLFDLFGTVVAYDRVEMGTRLGWEEIRQTLLTLGFEMEYEAFAVEWNQQFQTPLTDDQRTGETPFVDKILRYCGEQGLRCNTELARRTATACLEHWGRHIRLPDDTLTTLSELRRTHRLALVSNFDHPPFVHRLLAGLDLTAAFDYVVVSGDIAIDKPDPRIFMMALDALGCAPDEAVFVGDNLRTDIAGSHGAGLTPVLIDRSLRHLDYAGYRIKEMQELPALLERIGSG